MRLVHTAEHEISLAVLKVQHEHGLTDVEFLQILNGLAASILKYMLRKERHPENPTMPADEA